MSDRDVVESKQQQSPPITIVSNLPFHGKPDAGTMFLIHDGSDEFSSRTGPGLLDVLGLRNK